jgi:hypothetical protein
MRPLHPLGAGSAPPSHKTCIPSRPADTPSRRWGTTLPSELFWRHLPAPGSALWNRFPKGLQGPASLSTAEAATQSQIACTAADSGGETSRQLPCWRYKQPPGVPGVGESAQADLAAERPKARFLSPSGAAFSRQPAPPANAAPGTAAAPSMPSPPGGWTLPARRARAAYRKDSGPSASPPATPWPETCAPGRCTREPKTVNPCQTSLPCRNTAEKRNGHPGCPDPTRSDANRNGRRESLLDTISPSPIPGNTGCGVMAGPVVFSTGCASRSSIAYNWLRDTLQNHSINQRVWREYSLLAPICQAFLRVFAATRTFRLPP